MGIGMGLAEPTVINQMVSVTLSTYHRDPYSASSSCDLVVIPSQEQDTALSNDIKPQSIISCPFFSSSSHRMVSQLSFVHLKRDMSMLWRSYWQQGPIMTMTIM